MLLYPQIFISQLLHFNSNPHSAQELAIYFHGEFIHFKTLWYFSFERMDKLEFYFRGAKKTLKRLQEEFKTN